MTDKPNAERSSRITADVTDDHINRGLPLSGHCPLALALHERYGGSWVVLSTAVILRLYSPRRNRVFAHNKRSLKFVRDWDRGLVPKAQRIQLNLSSYSKHREDHQQQQQQQQETSL